MTMESLIIGISAIALLLVLISLGVHIAVALGILGLLGIVYLNNLEAALSLIARSFYKTTSTYGFSVLPLFIIMGHFAAASGIMEGAYRFATRWLSNLRGGLYLVTTSACALFAACTGSSSATAVAIGKSVLPEMQRHGYNRSLSLGCIAVCGTLGVLIPPSVPLVMYGIATEESIGRLLLAGVVPGVVTTLVYLIGISFMVRIKRHLAPPTVAFTWKQRVKSVPDVWGVALLFGIVIGGIYSGVFTPTEAGSWGAFAAVVLLAIRTRKRFFREAKIAGWETVGTTAMIFFLIMTAIVFTNFLTLSGFVGAIVDFIVGGRFSPLLVLTLFIGISIILGMFMSAAAALLLISPIAHATLTPLGFDGIWLGIIMVKMFEIAVVTPPVATNLYVTQSLCPEASIGEVIRGTVPFLVMELVTIVILVVFPQISLWLPTMAYG